MNNTLKIGKVYTSPEGLQVIPILNLSHNRALFVTNDFQTKYVSWEYIISTDDDSRS